MSKVLAGLLSLFAAIGPAAVAAPAGAVAPAGAAGAGAAAEATQRVKITLAEVTDSAGKASFELLEATALSQLQQELKLEDRLHDKAMGLTEKAWKADDFTKTKIFPRSAIEKRSLKILGTYTSKEAADAALNKEEDKIRRAEERRAEQEKKRAELNKNNTNNNNLPKKSAKSSTAEAEREQLDSRARDIYASKMKELIAAAANPAAGAANPPPAAGAAQPPAAAGAAQAPAAGAAQPPAPAGPKPQH